MRPTNNTRPAVEAGGSGKGGDMIEKVIARKTYSDGDQLAATLDGKGEVRIYTVSAQPDLRFTSADGWQYQESMTEKEFEVWRKQYGI